MTESLEAAIQRAGSPAEFLRESQYPAYEFPVNPEFTNWRSEQTSWRESCVLLDQSHHMANLFLKGPEALKLLSDYGVNTFANFRAGMAKQMVSVNSEGYFIGDAILFAFEDDSFDLVGNPSLLNWIHYQAETGDHKLDANFEPNSNRRVGPPELFRYELQGPTALPLVEKLNGGEVPEVKFFHMTQVGINGTKYSALRHGMAGQPGFEIYGPWADGERVLDAIIEAGKEFGLVRVGARAYATANLESGWMPRPMTAIFSPDEKAYREWLPSNAVGSLGGSMDAKDITEYYHSPFDIGYGKIVKFDHDFYGRDALEKIAAGENREKVNLVWNVDDVLAIFRSQYEQGTPAKAIEFPKARYAYFQVDKILKDGEYAGMSTDVGYNYNDRVMISIASIDPSLAEPGNEVTVLWGEEPNTSKPGVEPHRQVEVNATVAPIPYSPVVRDAYRK